MARTSEQLTSQEIITVEELQQIANDSVIYKDSTWIYQRIVLWASGTVLQSNGATSAPTFGTVSAWDVVWPSSATDNAIVRFDLATWKLIQNSSVLIDDSDNITGINSLLMNTAPWAHSDVEWLMHWENWEWTLSIKTDVSWVNLQVWQESHVRVRNSTWSQIDDWLAVFISGSTWTLPNITKAQANNFNQSSKTIWLATHDIANNTNGIVTTFWLVRDIDTSAFAAWDLLFLDAVTAWALTATAPTWLNFVIVLWTVITSNPTTWKIFVSPKIVQAFSSVQFKIIDSTDTTKQIEFDASWITTGTKRKITMPDNDVDLSVLWHTIQDEWVDETDRANLNFTGVWVTVTDDSWNDATVVDIWAALSTSYTVTNVTTDRAYDADSTTLNEIADVLWTVIADMTTNNAISETQSFVIAASDETTELSAWTSKIKFRMPYGFELSEVRASLNTAATWATLLQVDINESWTTILSTKITIDASETTSTTAATAPVISDSTLADDAEITIDLDAIWNTTPWVGLKVYLIWTKI